MYSYVGILCGNLDIKEYERKCLFQQFAFLEKRHDLEMLANQNI
jgi:hypothetical protein